MRERRMAGGTSRAWGMADDFGDDDLGEGQVSLRERADDVSALKSVREDLLDVFKDVEKGFEDQWERSNDQTDYWEIYNCKLNAKQFYSGNSKIYVPIVHNAVNARKTRFTNQIFPQSGRYVDVTSSDGTKPDALMALLEHYVRQAQLRTKVMPALMRSGDIEGQYNVYVSWEKHVRNVTFRSTSTPEIDDTSGLENPAVDPVEDISEETVERSYPSVEVLADADVLVLPQTSDSLSEAISNGGSVTILRRWGKAKIRKMMADGVIRKKAGEDLIGALQSKAAPAQVNRGKQMTDAAGIRGEGSKYAQVYETFTMLEVRGEKRLYQAFYGGAEKILGCRRNPNWSDRLPLLSVPVEKVAGAFKGISKVKPCADMQYAANDAVNEAWDSAAFSMMPIVMTDPEKNPRVGSMVLSLAAVWETSPNDTQVMQFPKLWEDGFAMVNACKAEVGQTLSVSPAAITQGAAEKMNQAEIAQEQQIDILTTADAVTVVEDGILTPMLDLFIELDHQFRDKPLTVRQFGQMGVEANLEEIPPVQMENRFVFRWFGVEQARSAQQIQQQIAGMNVIRGIPPQQLNGYQVNLVPIITQLVENTFGPRLAPLIFVSPEAQLPVPADQENALLSEGYEVPTHQMDDDQQHIAAHQAAIQQMEMMGEKKNNKKFLEHIWKHTQQIQAKQQAAMQAQMQPPAGAPGVPGGAGPGVAGTPRQGAQPGQPRFQGPSGMIHQDQMQDPTMMPRKIA